jgi:hypothetical protein
MAAHEERDRSAPFRGELQPAGGAHAGALHLADHRTKAAVTQPFLHQREQFGIVACLGIKDAFGRQPCLIEAGSEQIAATHDPQDRAPGTRGDPGHEQGGGGIVRHFGRAGRNLVQGIQPQPAIGQPRIDLRNPERQRFTPAMTVAFNGAERFAKLCNDGGRGHWHDSIKTVVPILFQQSSESIRQSRAPDFRADRFSCNHH